MGAEQPETKFCQECGVKINKRAEICPECGVRQPGTEVNGERKERANRARQFLSAGGILGFIALLLFPIIFGPLAVVCGLLALYYGRPIAGAGVVAWGVITTIIGWLIGFLVWGSI